MLEGLYWGDNVVWQLDGAPVEPFYAAIAGRAETFEGRTFVAIADTVPALGAEGLEVMRAGPGTALAHPADLLREVHRLCRPGGRRLLLFDSLDRMVEAWGASRARGFLCPMPPDAARPRGDRVLVDEHRREHGQRA